MKYIITGSTGNISKPLSKQLIYAGHDVSIISSNADKVKEIEDLGANALIGSVEDPSFLMKAFEGADAVYTMVPPNMTADNWKEFIFGVGDNYVRAIQAAGIKKAVNLSSVGAHIADGGGLTSLYYHVEQEFNKLEGVDVLHLRPGTFYYNYFGNIGMIKHMGIVGNNYADKTVPMVHPNDIAKAAFEELSTLGFTGKSVRYIAGDELSTDEIAKTLGDAVGKPDLKWVKFADNDALNGMIQAGVSKDVAENLVKMGQGVESGEMLADYYKHKPELSPIKFKDFAKEFAVAYANG